MTLNLQTHQVIVIIIEVTSQTWFYKNQNLREDEGEKFTESAAI